MKRRNRKRREKLGDLCFELAKYIITAYVIGWFIEPEIRTEVLLSGSTIGITLLIVGYFLFPLDRDGDRK